MENLIKEILEITKKHKYSIDKLEIMQSDVDKVFLDLILIEDCESGDLNGDC